MRHAGPTEVVVEVGRQTSAYAERQRRRERGLGLRHVTMQRRSETPARRMQHPQGVCAHGGLDLGNDSLRHHRPNAARSQVLLVVETRLRAGRGDAAYDEDLVAVSDERMGPAFDWLNRGAGPDEDGAGGSPRSSIDADSARADFELHLPTHELRQAVDNAQQLDALPVHAFKTAPNAQRVGAGARHAGEQH